MVLERLANISDFLYRPLMLKIFAAIAVFLLGLIVGHILSNALRRLLNEFGVDKALRFFNLTFSIENLLSIFTRYLIYIAAFLQALNIIGIATPLLNIIVIAFVVMFLLSFLMSLKDFFPNIIAGLKLRQNKDISIGDHVMVSGVDGFVESLGLLETRIQSKGSIFMIPNKKFLDGFTIIKKAGTNKELSLKKNKRIKTTNRK